MGWRRLGLVRNPFLQAGWGSGQKGGGERPLTLSLLSFIGGFTDSQSKSVIVNTASEETTRKNDDWFGEAKVENIRYG